MSSDFDTTRFLLGLGAVVLAVAALQLITLAIALRQRRHSVVDVTWGLGFVAVVWCGVAASAGTGDAGRSAVLATMVSIWGLRLAWHIARRNAGHGEDPRYADLLAKAPPQRRVAYAVRMIYLLQGGLIVLIGLPVLVPQFAEDDLGAVAIVGIVLWSVGLVFEAVGDRQLAAFKADPANRGTIMDRGLWRYTRHPNYFGDACVWWGLFLVAAETGVGAATVLSPIVMTWFLTQGSGARLTEKRMRDRPGYADYAARTSGFLPLPPRRG